MAAVLLPCALALQPGALRAPPPVACATPPRPLSLLKGLGDESRFVASSRSVAGTGTSQKYCKYDDIRKLTAESRARSRQQGRDGCCDKAANYLEQPSAEAEEARQRWLARQ